MSHGTTKRARLRGKIKSIPLRDYCLYLCVYLFIKKDMESSISYKKQQRNDRRKEPNGGRGLSPPLHYGYLISLLVFVFTVHCVTLYGGFTFDDHEAIETNQDVR